MSMRGVERVFSVSRNTLAQWLAEEADALPELSSTLAEPRPDDVLELDELWSFVLRKSNKRWVWLALCRRTRQIVAFVIGDRSEATCRQLWERIPEAYRHCHTFSDFWEAYQLVFSEATHSSVGKDSGQTNHIERWNNTLRQRLARFVRRTLSFSKSDRFHELVLKIFIHRYNFSRLHLVSQN
jgi:insertion element IS1 protein InsB